MSRYIDADAALRKLDDFYITALIQQKHDDVPEDYKKHWKGTASGINYSRNTIIETPTADVVEVRHGHWIERIEKPDWLEDDVEVYYDCSECGTSHWSIMPPYCPECGAKMDEKKENK